MGEGDGNVTYGEAFTVQPFGNSLVTMTLTAQNIKHVLEQQTVGCRGQLGTRILIPSAGFKYSRKPSAACDARISDVRLVDVITGSVIDQIVNADGSLPDPGKTYRQPVAHWIDVLNRAGVPCGRVLDMQQVFDDPQTRHQQMRITIDHPQHGALDVLGFPIKFTDEPCRVHRPPPVLGADTDAILADLGLGGERITALRDRKVI